MLVIWIIWNCISKAIRYSCVITYTSKKNEVVLKQVLLCEQKLIDINSPNYMPKYTYNILPTVLDPSPITEL